MATFWGPFTVGFVDTGKPVDRFPSLQQVKISHRLQADLCLRKSDLRKFILSWKGPDEESEPIVQTDSDLEFYLTPDEEMCFWGNGKDGKKFVHEAFWLFETIESAKEEALRRRPSWGRIITIYSMTVLKKEKWIHLTPAWKGRVRNKSQA